MMRLTVLGASPACQNPGGACSGYLLEQDGVALLIDCGSGVVGRLQQYIAPEKLQAVLISHMHADHTMDLIPYRYYLYFTGEGQHIPRPNLYLPPGGHERLLGLSRLQDPSTAFFTDTFAVQEYDPLATLAVGPFSISFVPVHHIPHTYGIRIIGDACLAFSADSGPCDALATVAQGSDLFLCECANSEHSDFPFHLTSRQAGAVAQQAGARRLLLTHRWWVYGQDAAVSEAQEQFTGPVALAREDMQIVIAP